MLARLLVAAIAWGAVWLGCAWVLYGLGDTPLPMLLIVGTLAIFVICFSGKRLSDWI